MHWIAADKYNFCKNTASSLYLISDIPHWYAGRPMELHQCDACGLVRASPRPDPLELYRNYLNASESARIITDRKLNRPNVRLRHRAAIEEAISYADREVDSLYDMGCGAGTIMMEARDMGLVAEGNDVNKASIEMLSSLGLKAYLGFSKDVNPGRTYDIVTNLDYLEHSYEPFDDLNTCYRILNTGGVLYLKTLYLGCPNHVRDGEGWNLFGNGHFHYFFPDTLREMVIAAGFEIAEFKLAALVTVIGLRRAS